MKEDKKTSLDEDEYLTEEQSRQVEEIFKRMRIALAILPVFVGINLLTFIFQLIFKDVMWIKYLTLAAASLCIAAAILLIIVFMKSKKALNEIINESESQNQEQKSDSKEENKE